jgi:hypothetical protein
MAIEFWIEGGVLMTWMDSRRIQSKFVARDVIDGDNNPQTGEWLVVKSNGRVESLDGRLGIPARVFSHNGLRARWIGNQVQVQERDGRTRLYDSRGFLQRVY